MMGGSRKLAALAAASLSVSVYFRLRVEGLLRPSLTAATSADKAEQCLQSWARRRALLFLSSDHESWRSELLSVRCSGKQLAVCDYGLTRLCAVAS